MALTRSDFFGVAQGLDQGVAADRAFAAEGARLAFAGHDRSDGIDQRDPRIAAARGGGLLDAHHRFHQFHEAAETGIIGVELLLAIFGGRTTNSSAPRLSFRLVDQFVLIADAIDELGLFGPLGREQALVDQRFDLGLFQVAIRGDGAHHLRRSSRR